MSWIKELFGILDYEIERKARKHHVEMRKKINRIVLNISIEEILELSNEIMILASKIIGAEEARKVVCENSNAEEPPEEIKAMYKNLLAQENSK